MGKRQRLHDALTTALAKERELRKQVKHGQPDYAYLVAADNVSMWAEGWPRTSLGLSACGACR
jgi:hypothetical protein